MNNVTQLIPPTPDERAAAFEEFNKWYPHNPGRRNKAKARSIFMEITAGGTVITKSFHKDSNSYKDAYHVNVTAGQLIEAVKQYRKALIPKATGEFMPETTYVPYADVWLNSGRYEDFL